MVKNRHRNNRYRCISIQLFIEEECILSDIIHFRYNTATDNIGVYDAINFRKKTSPFVTLCKDFSKPRIMRPTENTRYDRRRKYVSIKILKEEGCVISDVMLIQYNRNADNFNIYDVIRFGRWFCDFVPVFKRFSKPRVNKFAETAKNKIKESIEKNNSISSTEIMQETGIDQSIINRYYMSLKRTYR
jgi:hypothetical protein